MMDGFINFLKPPGMTSSDCVLFARRLLPKKTPVGHGGTLDPDAAGVLPICVGRATRLFDYIIDKQKTYIGELTLGVATDTCDSSGKITEKSSVTATAKDIKAVLGEFTGDIMQAPPAYSAIKRGGTPLYALARRGEVVETELRQVHVYGIEYISQTAENRHLLQITCGKGVYIRSLMRDIGERLGCPAHMSFLLRSRAGAFDVKDALSPEELVKLESIESALMPLDYPLGAFPRIDLGESRRKHVLAGASFRSDKPTDAVSRVYVEGDFAGMCEPTPEGLYKFRCMLLRP